MPTGPAYDGELRKWRLRNKNKEVSAEIHGCALFKEGHRINLKIKYIVDFGEFYMVKTEAFCYQMYKVEEDFDDGNDDLYMG